MELELQKICDDILARELYPIDQHWKVKGVQLYYGYLVEPATSDAVSKVAQDARIAFAEDTKTVEKDLVAIHPIRLAMALNFSFFQYEVFENTDEACMLAHVAFENANAETGNVGKDSCKDSTLIMDAVMKFGAGADVESFVKVKQLITDSIDKLQSESSEVNHMPHHHDLVDAGG